jgi:peptidoglycan/xylan/chitin deacetylase (PgdA/CDA1 family)
MPHPLVVLHPPGLAATLSLAGAAVVGAGTYAAMAPSSRWFGRTLVAGADPLQVALTFDDGPNGDTTARLLDKLAAANVKATFFLVGRYVLAQPEMARRIAAQGHAIGNHSMTHPHMLLRGPMATQQELADCSRAIFDTTGVETKLFRPPFGGRWPHTLWVSKKLGLRPVMWNALGFDWRLTDPTAIAARLLNGIHRNRAEGVGSNLLLHDGSHKGLGWDRNPTLAAVDRVLQAQGKLSQFVTVDAWL